MFYYQKYHKQYIFSKTKYKWTIWNKYIKMLIGYFFFLKGTKRHLASKYKNSTRWKHINITHVKNNFSRKTQIHHYSNKSYPHCKAFKIYNNSILQIKIRVNLVNLKMHTVLQCTKSYLYFSWKQDLKNV